MLECVYCSSENPEKNNFCCACKRQIRCLSCKEALDKNADMCFSCGQVVKTRQIEVAHNTYELDEAHNARTGNSSRKIRISFSDNALESVAPALSGMLGMASSTQSTVASQRKIFHQASSQTKTIDALPQNSEVTGTINTSSPISAKSLDSAEELLAFEIDDYGELITTINDFKGKSQSEQQKRFIVLYILDYQSVSSKAPTDEEVVAAANKLGFYDKSNFKRYLKSIKNDYFVPAGEKLRPRDNLQAYLDEIGSQLRDESLKGASMNSPKKPFKKRSSTSSLTDSDIAYIKEITDKHPQIKQINSRDLTTVEIVAIGLYLLKKFESIETLKLRVLHGILGMTRGFGVEFKSFHHNLKRSEVSNKSFHFKGDGNIELLPNGETIAENKLSSIGISV